ncbi:MAG TPA: HAD family hydrolase [Dehalococcoidia bacterium]|nr:HAD family hydrolase [Dehalococcoidia bacterium]
MKALVFDFDGTLAEARDAFVECYRRASVSLGLTQPTREDVMHFIGTPVPVAFLQMYPEQPESRAAEYAASFQRHADDVMAPLTTMLDGVPEALRVLHAAGYKLGIVSQKLRRRLDDMLRREDLRECFGVLIGGDDMPAFKPDPRGLVLAIDALGVTPDGTLYIGDTPIDAETAQRANVGFIGVLSGVFGSDHFAPFNPLTVLESVRDLPAYLDGVDS